MILKVDKGETQTNGSRNKKWTTTWNALFPINIIGRHNVSSKEARRLASIEDYVNASIKDLEGNIKKKQRKTN